MNGFTISEMAQKLDITYETVQKRLERAGLKPVFKGALYEESALEIIRNAPPVGRPPKAKG